jgi:hypothetical protein
VIVPALRHRREPTAPRDVVYEVAEILATAYLRLRSRVTAPAEVREKEASSVVAADPETMGLEVHRTPSVSATTSPASAAGRPGAPR